MKKEDLNFQNLTPEKIEEIIEYYRSEGLADVPENERWIYKSENNLRALLTGIMQAQNGQFADLGDFTQYLDEE